MGESGPRLLQSVNLVHAVIEVTRGTHTQLLLQVNRCMTLISPNLIEVDRMICRRKKTKSKERNRSRRKSSCQISTLTKTFTCHHSTDTYPIADGYIKCMVCIYSGVAIPGHTQAYAHVKFTGAWVKIM